MRARISIAAAILVVGGVVPPAQANVGIAANCRGDLVASHALVDRDGVGAQTAIGQLRVDVYHSPADGGTICVMTLGGDAAVAGALPMLAMLVTDDGHSALDRGEYRHHAAVSATMTDGHCVLIHAATQLRPLGQKAPATAGDWFFLPGAQRKQCWP